MLTETISIAGLPVAKAEKPGGKKSIKYFLKLILWV